MHLCLFVIVSLPGSINEDQEKSHRPQTLRSLSALYSSTSSQRNISKKPPDPLSEFSEKSLELTEFWRTMDLLFCAYASKRSKCSWSVLVHTVLNLNRKMGVFECWLLCWNVGRWWIENKYGINGRWNWDFVLLALVIKFPTIYYPGDFTRTILLFVLEFWVCLYLQKVGLVWVPDVLEVIWSTTKRKKRTEKKRWSLQGRKGGRSFLSESS